MGAMKLIEGQAIELEDGTMAYVQNAPKRKYNDLPISATSFGATCIP